MYDVASLIPLVETFLINNLTSENVVVVANSASFFPDSNISKETVDFIIKKSDILKSEAEFCELNADVLLEVLKCEEGNLICHPNNIGPNVKCLTCNKQASFPESQLFDMVLLWAKNQCKLQELEENPKNMKEILEPFLPWIRFPTMTVEYLTKVV
uniref:Uncharacterized protein n=1 Tax=Panagrolaimus sp. JU765 TaxID=591449 RepID=A0AC34QD16_9BILA